MSSATLHHLLSKEDCQKILRKYLNEGEPFKLSKYNITKFSDSVIGFLGEHLRLKITYTKTDHDQSEEITFFIKALPQFNKTQNEYVKGMNIFSKESLVYRNLLSEYSKEVKQFAPTMYLNKDEVIVLEDLRRIGYSVSKSAYFEFHQCRALMQTLGRFHAASVIFEEKRSKPGDLFRIGEHYPREVAEATFSFDMVHPRGKWFATTTKCVLDCLKTMPVDEVILGKLERVMHVEMADYLKPSTVYRNVLTHDDLWSNNIMFNMEDCLLVDFQLTRYSPPAFDVLLGLYLNASEEFLDKHLNECLEIYYQCFADELAKKNIDVNLSFPWNVFQESAKFYTLPALVESAMYGTNTQIPQKLSQFVVSDMTRFQEFSYVDRSKYVVKEFVENLDFRERYSSILNNLVKCLRNIS